MLIHRKKNLQPSFAEGDPENSHQCRSTCSDFEEGDYIGGARTAVKYNMFVFTDR